MGIQLPYWAFCGAGQLLFLLFLSIPWLVPTLLWSSSPIWLVFAIVILTALPCCLAVAGSSGDLCGPGFLLLLYALPSIYWCLAYSMEAEVGPVLEQSVVAQSNFPDTNGFYFTDGDPQYSMTQCSANPNRLDHPCANQEAMLPVLDRAGSDWVAFMVYFPKNSAVITTTPGTVPE